MNNTSYFERYDSGGVFQILYIKYLMLQVLKLQAAIKYGEEDLPAAQVKTVHCFVAFTQIASGL